MSYDDSNDPLLRPGVAAKRLGVATETLRRWMVKGIISYVEIGPFRQKRIRQSEIDQYRREQPSSG